MNDRRRLMLRSLAAAPLVALAACATPLGRYTLEEGVTRLLTLSSQRAFARLTQPGGFYDDQLTRITPPAAGGNGDVLAAVLGTNAVRRRVAFALNDIAVEAADRAAPIVIDGIRGMSFGDALAIARGGPTAATDLLERQVGDALVQAMFPEFSAGLGADMAEILSAIAAARGAPDYVGLARAASALASRSIFRAIGREEQAIRADPRATRDPAIIALLLGGSGALSR